MLHVLQVSPYYFPEVKYGGPPLKMFGLARALRAEGCEVSVATFRSEERSARSVELMENVAVRFLPWLGWGTRQIPRSTRVLREAVRKADVVHAFGLYNTLSPLTAIICKRFEKPFVLEPLGTYKPRANNKRIKRLYNVLVTRRMVALSAGVIATSTAEKNELVELVPIEKLYTRNNGIDLAPFRRSYNRVQARKDRGIDDKTIVVLFVGRISAIKNLETLILSFRESGLSDAHLYLVGPKSEPAYARKLEKLVRDNHMERQVFMLGPQYDELKLQAFASADLFVLPSISESFGNAAAEAVAAGLPVLLTDTCGIAPMIDGVAGLVVPCTQAGITNGLRHMADRNRRAFYVRDRERLISKLSWDQPVRQQLDIYRTVLNAHSGSFSS